MSRTTDGKKFSDTLDDTEEESLPESHKKAIIRGIVLQNQLKSHLNKKTSFLVSSFPRFSHTMHRFFIPPHSIKNEGFSSTDKELCHQVSKVLKMRPGKKIVFCDNTEHEYLAEWILVSKSDCQAKILEKTSKPDTSSSRAMSPSEPNGNQKPVHLFVPPLKNQNRFELILEKCTEIGVASFTPLITERTEVTELRKLDRLYRIIKEAAEVSGRTKLPDLNEPISFEEILTADYDPSTINILPTLHESSKTIPEILKNLNPKSPKSLKSPNSPNTTPIGVYIGPVGDFSKEEIEKAVSKGFHPVSLGTQVLRTETAAIVATSLYLCSNY